MAHTFYTTAQNPLQTAWYHWTPLVSGIVQVDTAGTNPNAIAPLYITPYVIDTTVAVYTGSTLATLIRKAESDNWLANTITSNCLVNRPVGESLNSSCSRFLVTAGTTYHFQVDKLSETDPSNNTLLLRVNLLTPTAANVSVSGRVTDAAGQGLSRVIVSMTDMDGNVQMARTSTFGYYQFENVAVGSYILQAASKSYQFDNNPRVLNIVDNVLDADFVSAGK
ncbi:MAG: carboxypeptidase-like regulatory domain-containing protein [Pyrinomonadaceae bacterium]